MNDRINILAEQAGFYVSESRLEILAPDSTTDNVTEALREFAELIVKECADICMELATKCAGLPSEGALAVDCANLIKQDFGVEE